MIQVIRSFNEALVHELLTHDDVWAESVDDFSPSRDSFVPQLHDLVYYMVPYTELEPMGIFMLIPKNSTTYDWHTGILKKYRGKLAHEAVELTVDWVCENTIIRKLITWVDCDQKHVVRFAKDRGFAIEGCSTDSVMRDGKLKDQFLMGRTLPCQSPP
jgi:RimJ/RimL family protein N-acetyltransferase